MSNGKNIRNIQKQNQQRQNPPRSAAQDGIGVTRTAERGTEQPETYSQPLHFDRRFPIAVGVSLVLILVSFILIVLVLLQLKSDVAQSRGAVTPATSIATGGNPAAPVDGAPPHAAPPENDAVSLHEYLAVEKMHRYDLYVFSGALTLLLIGCVGLGFYFLAEVVNAKSRAVERQMDLLRTAVLASPVTTQTGSDLWEIKERLNSIETLRKTIEMMDDRVKNMQNRVSLPAQQTQAGQITLAQIDGVLKQRISDLEKGLGASFSAAVSSGVQRAQTQSPPSQSNTVTRPVQPQTPPVASPALATQAPSLQAMVETLGGGCALLRNLLADNRQFSSNSQYSAAMDLYKQLDTLKNANAVSDPLMQDVGEIFAQRHIQTASPRQLKREEAAFQAQAHVAMEVARQAAALHLRQQLDVELIETYPLETNYDKQYHDSTRGTEIEVFEPKLQNLIAKVIRHGYLRPSTREIVRKAVVQVYRVVQPGASSVLAVPSPNSLPVTAVPINVDTEDETRLLTQAAQVDADRTSSVSTPIQEQRPNSLAGIGAAVVDEETPTIVASMVAVDQGRDECEELLQLILNKKKEVLPMTLNDWKEVAEKVTIVYHNAPTFMDRAADAVRELGNGTAELVLPEIGSEIKNSFEVERGTREGRVSEVRRIGIIVADKQKVEPIVCTNS